MPRLAHGKMITEQRVQQDRESVLEATAEVPLAFATVQLTEHQEFD